MSGLQAALLTAWQALSWLEGVAVVLAIAYLVLAARENIWCWACAFVSTAIYIALFYRVALLSESLLNVFYLLMAVYGWWQWRRGAPGGKARAISRWSPRRHLLVIAGTGACVPLLGYWMANSFNASLPYLDAFTTCFAVVTTWMVTHKILENWLYWIVIDSVSIYLYVEKELYLTALLFVLYLGICVVGFVHWRRQYRQSTAVGVS